MSAATKKIDYQILLITVVVTVMVITVINNVSALKKVKDQVNGRRGWF